jgi:hypothetical protein
MSKQTAMQELKEFCEYRLTKATNENKSAWNMILAKIEDDGLIETEKQQLIDAFWNGDNSDCTSEQNSKEFAEQYYNETFNK